MVHESQTERFSCSTNESSFTESGIGGSQRVENKSEVRVCAKVIISQDLIVENEQFFKLIEAVVVERDSFNLTKKSLYQIGSITVI